MRFLFSLFKPKKPKQKEDPMSEVQQHLAAIDEIYKVASFTLSQRLIDLAWRFINCPEILGKITQAEGQALVQFALNDPQNFANQAKSLAVQIQQRPLGN
jgi:hypothetical protein